MSFNNPTRRFFEPNAEEQSAFNEVLKETRNLTSEIKSNFISVSNEVKDLNESSKSLNQNFDVFLTRLKSSKGIVNDIKKDFDRLGKSSPKIEVTSNVSKNINNQLKESKSGADKIGESLVQGLKEGNSLATELLINTQLNNKETDKSKDITKEKSVTERLINFMLKDQVETLKAINEELKEGINYTKEVRKQYGVLEDIATKLLDDNEEIAELTEKQLEKEKTRAQQALKRLQESGKSLINKRSEIELTRKLTDQEEILIKAHESGFELEKQTLSNLTYEIDKRKLINKQLGITGSLIKSIEKISGKLGITGLEQVFKDAKKEAESVAKELINSEKSMSRLTIQTKVMGAGLKSLGKGLLSTFKDPLVVLSASIGAIGLSITLLKKFFSIYGEINQRTTEQGRQLGINYKESDKLRKSALDYAASQRNAFVTEKHITEGRAKLNEALGTSVAYTNEESITAEKLSHYYGISAEQNGKLVQLSKVLGTSNKKILDTVLKTAVEQKAQRGGTISYQNILKQVSNVSGDILTRFKGNVAELTKAVMQADRLGLTLEQVDKVGESLLNFEQSIESELKAELLTGKAINLEKARAAALSGDTVKLTNEIAKQVGNIHQFEKMNVIQRKAYAEAFGMTASEMGDMLRKQEFEAKLAGSGAKTAQEKLDYAKKHNIAVAESIEKDLEAKSLAELQKDTFVKIKEVLSRITEGPMTKLFGMLEKGLKFVEKIVSGFSSMTGGALGSALAGAIIGIPAILGVVGVASTLLRLFSGRIFKDALLPKPSGRMGDQIHVIVDGGMTGGMGGGIPMGGMMPMRGVGMPMIPGQGPRPFQAPIITGPMTMPSQTPTTMGGGMVLTNAAPKTAGRFAMGSMGAMGLGMGLGIGGTALNMASANMEEGGAKQAVGVLGQTAQFAGMGAMFGPWGAAIGGLVGLGVGLFSMSKENEERRKQEEAQRAESNRQTQELINNLSVRPLELNVNNETIGKWNTYSSQNGANPSFA